MDFAQEAIGLMGLTIITFGQILCKRSSSMDPLGSDCELTVVL